MASQHLRVSRCFPANPQTLCTAPHGEDRAMMPNPPTAVPFESIDPVLTPQGHRIRPLVDGRPGGNAPEIDICAGGLDVPAGFIANAHWHPETDVIVLVYDCGDEGALTLFGDDLEYEAVQHRGDLLPIQRGWAHTVVNLRSEERRVG